MHVSSTTHKPEDLPNAGCFGNDCPESVAGWPSRALALVCRVLMFELARRSHKRNGVA
jgi:hypothetical protein